MDIKLGVFLFLLGLAKDASTGGSSRRAVPGPDCYMSTQPECSLKREAVGCFKNKAGQRVLPELLYTAKDRNSAVYFGEKINWLEWANFIDRFTCACAKKARNKSFDYFGIENYGECWGGMNVGGSSRKCQVVKANECAFEDCNQQHNDSRLCVGGSRVIYVYSIKQAQPTTMPPSTKPPTQVPSTMPPTQPPTKGPSTMPPTQPPTKGPSTMPPTQPPTKGPSTMPPTQPPTKGPSTMPPTQPPTKGPSTMPPTQPPTEAPSTMPPTQPPTEGPSTMPPTQPPTKGPSTVPPTQPPTKGPSTMPPSTQPPTKETPTVPPVTQPPTTAPASTPRPPAPTTAPPMTTPELEECEE